MLTLPHTETIPIRLDEHGVARIGSTRVTLDTVIAAFYRGSTAEAIVDQYPALSLPQIYLVLGYYLTHRGEVDAYIQAQKAEAAQIRQEVEKRFPPEGIRARLLARLEEKKQPS